MNQFKSAAIASSDAQTSDAGLPTYTELLSALRNMERALAARIPGSSVVQAVRGLLDKIDLCEAAPEPAQKASLSGYPKYGHTYPH